MLAHGVLLHHLFFGHRVLSGLLRIVGVRLREGSTGESDGSNAGDGDHSFDRHMSISCRKNNWVRVQLLARDKHPSE